MRGQHRKKYILRNIPIIYIITCNQFKNIFTKLPRKYVGKTKIMIRPELCYSDLVTVRKYDNAQNYIIKKENGNMGIIYLNRPEKFNSMNWSMAILMYKILQDWEKCRTHVVWKSNVKNIFSGGGDVKLAYYLLGLEPGLRYGIEMAKFLHKLCYFIGTYQKPFISILDGISFGGVTAMAVNSKFSVATENTIYSTPETTIGLNPDVGSIYKLSKLNKNLGLYLALTGNKLIGSDVWLAGITTYFIPSSRIHLLTKELTESDGSNISEILEHHNIKDLPNKSTLEPYIEKINHCFSARAVEEIIDRLKDDNSEWGNSTAKILTRNSPTALKMTKRGFDLASKKNFKDCIKMEYTLGHAALYADFGEGVRARLVDKDNKPNWHPRTLSGVTDEYINKLLSIVPYYDELEL